tara:strand:+ start:2112 stop:2285 length:174 start_codon:yes stop_codon:yes gene_type:complete
LIIGEDINNKVIDVIKKIAKTNKEEIKVNFVNSICQLFSVKGDINKILYLLNFIKLD